MTDEEYTRAFARVNLCSGRWSASQARDKASELYWSWPNDSGLVLLGQKVARAFELQFRPFSVIGGRILSLPHPSGRNRQWNEAGARERARELIRVMMSQDRQER